MQDFSSIVENIETIKGLAQKGDAEAQNKLGICYEYGLAEYPQNDAEAAKWFMKAAEQGYMDAQKNLASCYKEGIGVLQNDGKAFEWFEKAAIQGDIVAQNNVGYFYSLGIGVEQDYSKAFEWFKKAAEQGQSVAQTNLAGCYEKGRGVAQDYEKAFEWYYKAAEKGDDEAQTAVGIFLQHGKGIKRNYVEAFEWFTKAAEQGNGRAHLHLGAFYHDGLGVKRNYKVAVKNFKIAAEQGFVYAQFNLGLCYERGHGVTKNSTKALEWYRKAAEQGDNEAEEATKRIEELLSKEESQKINYSTRQKINGIYYSRVIPLGNNYIVSKNRLWGIVDDNNSVLLPIKYTRVHWFEGGFAGIQINNQWGLVNSRGLVIIEPQYDALHYLSQYNACEVEKDGEEYIVDSNNNILLKIEGKATSFLSGKIIARSPKENQLYNLDGTTFSKTHLRIISIGDKFNGYDVNNEHTLIKSNGEEVKLPKFETGVFIEHITPFRYQNKYGIIDENASIVVPNKYDYISLGSGVIAINEGNVSQDNDSFFFAIPNVGEWFFWNYKFQAITPYRYDVMRCYSVNDKKLWLAKRDDCWYKITPNGEVLFARNEEEYKKKKSNLTRNRKAKGIRQFAILEDPNYKGDDRKLFVRACDGKYIRHFYYTPYLPIDSDELHLHWEIGDSYVNIYGQDMPNPHAFKMDKQKKPRFVFKSNPSIQNLDEKELIGLFVNLLKPSGFTKKQINTLYTLFETKQKRAIICDWLLRKYKRNKNTKFDFDKLSIMAFDVEMWVKKRL